MGASFLGTIKRKARRGAPTSRTGASDVSEWQRIFPVVALDKQQIATGDVGAIPATRNAWCNTFYSTFAFPTAQNKPRPINGTGHLERCCVSAEVKPPHMERFMLHGTIKLTFLQAVCGNYQE